MTLVRRERRELEHRSDVEVPPHPPTNASYVREVGGLSSPPPPRWVGCGDEEAPPDSSLRFCRNAPGTVTPSSRVRLKVQIPVCVGAFIRKGRDPLWLVMSPSRSLLTKPESGLRACISWFSLCYLSQAIILWLT